MYLSNKETSMLTEAVRYFEVGFRSFIAEKILKEFETEEKYKNAIISKNNSYSSTSIILSGRIKSLLEDLSKEHKIKKVYKLLQETRTACNVRKRVELKEGKSDAFLVISELISLTYIFFSDLFFDIIKIFPSREEYIYLSEQYRTIRNNLFHPEASISNMNYMEVNKFICVLTKHIDEKFFWYGSKEDLEKILDTLSISINNSLSIKNNLISMPKQKNKFVCRTNELNTLKTYLTGDEYGFGRMHYVLVSGFGGMGKTALVIEVIMQLIKDYTNDIIHNDRWYDFILFFSAKEELLDVEQKEGKVVNYNLKSQVSSLEDIKREIKKIIGTDCLRNLNKRGIIIIDNFETLSTEEKIKIDKFITFESDIEIQYVITSRTEENVNTNYQLPIRTFNEYDGTEFINKYLDENSFLIELNEKEKKKLVNLSKGNTLVLVLSLHRLNRGIELSVIERELVSIGSETVNNIVSFMSKNAFDDIYNKFNEYKGDIENILQVLVMYDEPIDKYSLMKLSGTNMLLVDELINALISGLILDEKREEIEINGFAKTYLLIKFKPNNVEYIQKKEVIDNYKRELTFKRNKLEECRKRNPQIDNILKEWQPNNIIDELAVLEAFNAYLDFNAGNVLKGKVRRRSRNYNLSEVNKYFKKIEETSTHPYIYAQKARILLPLLRYKDVKRDEIITCLKDSFDKTIISVETKYINIKGTISYASILREFGRFYLEEGDTVDLNKAANYSEKANEIYEKLKDESLYYYFNLKNLANAYMKMYEKNKENMYITEALKIWDKIDSSKSNEIVRIKEEATKKRSICIGLL